MDFKHNTTLLLLICLAGVVAAANLKLAVGGQKVLLSQLHIYPYAVSLRDKNHWHFCSGSLIAPDTVLAATHCFIDNGIFIREGSSVIAGEINIKVYNSPIAISHVYTHLYWLKNTTNAWKNDIAVAKLKSSFPVGPGTSINPINLPAYGEKIAGQTAMLVSFGYSHAEKNNSTQPNAPKYIYSRDPLEHLTRLNFQILNDNECLNDIRAICAKSLKPGAGSCPGDSGGPLVIDNKVVGIASTSTYSCDNFAPTSSHMTNVTHYLKWIEDAMTNKNLTKELLLHKLE